MFRFFTDFLSTHLNIYKVLIFFGCILFLVWISPIQTGFQYDLTHIEGKPWHHDDIIAPFDFFISKPKDRIEKELNEIKKNQKPYFYLDRNIQLNKWKEVDQGIAIWFALHPTKKKEQVKAWAKLVMDSLYSRGIIQLGDQFESKSNDLAIYVLQNGEGRLHEIGDFFSVQAAMEFIHKSIPNGDSTLYYPIGKILQETLSQNVFWDKVTTEKILNQEINALSTTQGEIVKDQRIIVKGELVDGEKLCILSSLKDAYAKQDIGLSNYSLMLLGQVICIGLCLSIIGIFLSQLRKDIFQDISKINFILLALLLLVGTANITKHYTSLNIYILPFCVLPIIIRAFFDARLALFIHTISILLIGLICKNKFEFVFIELLTGIIAIFSFTNLKKRSQLLFTCGIIFITYLVSYFGFSLIQNGTDVDLNWKIVTLFGVSSLLTMVTYPLIYIFERVFGFVSEVSLMEISDTNVPLLRELASKAPGTFQHSLQVANIAEEIAYQLDIDTQLVRAGGLYHDIGKLSNPNYFIENQIGHNNPHDQLNNTESAAIIINHVTYGIQLAKKHRIPESVIDFIKTHHGTSSTGYFLGKQKIDFPGQPFDENNFKYPGPHPTSKEMAIVMIVDAIEASSRSIDKIDKDKIHQLVETIIGQQIESGQFEDSTITFKEITLIKKLLKEKLLNMYHPRIAYPVTHV